MEKKPGGYGMLQQETLRRTIEKIPDYKTFLTVEEMDESSKRLAEEYPDVVTLFECGKSRDGHPLYCLKIGEGSKNAIFYGCPHPNEPIGAMMLEAFSRILAEDSQLRRELDYTFYLIKSWDVDGTKLNEGWFKGPYNIYNYIRHFFRPAPTQQVDWTFPIDYKNLHFHDSIPETQAVMKLIDELKPEFLYSLHNAGFGGVYYYMSRPMDEKLYEQVRAVAARHGVPLNLGEPEAPYCVLYSPAVYQGIGMAQSYDYYEKYGVEHPEELCGTGTCSSDYADSKYGSFTLLTELPYFYDERICDLSESDMTRREAILQNLDYSAQADTFIRETMKLSWHFIADNNPFKLAMDAFTRMSEDDTLRKKVETEAEYERLATVSEKFDNLTMAKFYKALSFGLMLRANETELETMKAVGEQNEEKWEALNKAMSIFEQKLKETTDYLESVLNYEVVPIKRLISIQMESGLIVADRIHGE